MGGGGGFNTCIRFSALVKYSWNVLHVVCYFPKLHSSWAGRGPKLLQQYPQMVVLKVHICQDLKICSYAHFAVPLFAGNSIYIMKFYVRPLFILYTDNMYTMQLDFHTLLGLVSLNFWHCIMCMFSSCCTFLFVEHVICYSSKLNNSICYVVRCSIDNIVLIQKYETYQHWSSS